MAFVVPDREGEHSAQTAKAFLAPAGKCGQKHLGVALRPERIPTGREFQPQFGVVVNAAVEDEVITTAGTRHGLVSAGGVDDGESTHPQRCRTPVDQALIIGAAVQHGFAHLLDGQTPLLVRAV